MRRLGLERPASRLLAAQDTYAPLTRPEARYGPQAHPYERSSRQNRRRTSLTGISLLALGLAVAHPTRAATTTVTNGTLEVTSPSAFVPVVQRQPPPGSKMLAHFRSGEGRKG